MTDKSFMAGRFARAVRSYDDNASVQRECAVRMADMLLPFWNAYSSGQRPACGGRFGKVLELGCGSGVLTRMLLDKINPEILYINDICCEYETVLEDVLTLECVNFIGGDAEKTEFPSRLDMIVSCSAVQWFHDLPAFFDKAAGLLSPGGLLAVSTFAPGNLYEISELEGPMLEYCTLDTLKNLASGKFGILASAEDESVLHFDSARSVLMHMKDTGVTGVRKEFWTKSRFVSFEERYNERFRTDKGLSLTYRPVWLLASKT